MALCSGQLWVGMARCSAMSERGDSLRANPIRSVGIKACRHQRRLWSYANPFSAGRHRYTVLIHSSGERDSPREDGLSLDFRGDVRV
ncbi:hypothetical protein MHYP_G00290660 [Metynnis hypsauchen]